MKNKIVLSIEQMKYLESLGVDTSDASMVWVIEDSYENPDFYLDTSDEYDLSHPNVIPAYTLQDILEVLKKQATCYISHNLEEFWAEDYPMHNMLVEFYDDNILLNAYQMLLWCIENNYIKTNKI